MYLFLQEVKFILVFILIHYKGDGIVFYVKRNSQMVTNFAVSANNYYATSLSVPVASGDSLYFHLNLNKTTNSDNTITSICNRLQLYVVSYF